MVTVGLARTKARAISRDERLLARVRHEHDFAFEHVDEFVFVRMPVALRRPRSRRERKLVDAELRETRREAEARARSLEAWLVERRGIARATTHRRGGHIDLFSCSRYRSTHAASGPPNAPRSDGLPSGSCARGVTAGIDRRRAGLQVEVAVADELRLGGDVAVLADMEAVCVGRIVTAAERAVGPEQVALDVAGLDVLERDRRFASRR